MALEVAEDNRGRSSLDQSKKEDPGIASASGPSAPSNGNSLRESHIANQASSGPTPTQAEESLSPAADTATEKLARDAQDLQNDISEYKGAGLNPVPSRIILCGLDKLNLEAELYKREDITLCTSGSARDYVQNRFGQDKEAPEDLRDASRDVSVPGLCLESTALSDGQALVRIYDQLSKKIVFEKLVPLESGAIPGADKAVLMGELNQAIDKVFSNNCEKHRRILESIAPDPTARERMTYTPGQVSMPLDSLSNLQNALGQARLEITCVGASRETDFSPSLKFDAKKLQALNGKGLEVNGQIQEITFYSEGLPVQNYDREKQLVDGKPTFSSHVDTQGNLITEKINVYNGRSGMTATKVLTIRPPLPLLLSGDPAETNLPVDLDLSFIGAGKVSGFITQRGLSPVKTLGNYSVFSNMNPVEVKQNFGETLACIAQGAETAETYFGIDPGHKLTNIYIANSKNENALFQQVNPTTITIQDEILKRDQPAEPIAFHETIHLLDGASNNVLSGGKFKERFDALTKEDNKSFFTKINEKNFLPGMTLGGHAQDNEFEFLASFCNSLNHPTWGPKMRSESPEFRAEYKKTLQALLDSVGKCDMIPKDAPVFLDLQHKITFLENLEGWVNNLAVASELLRR